jgi:hypothetical protein
MGLIVRVVGQCAQPDPTRSQPRPSATATPTRRSGRGHSVNLGFLHIPARTPYNSHLSIFIVECLGRFHRQWMTSMDIRAKMCRGHLRRATVDKMPPVG